MSSQEKQSRSGGSGVRHITISDDLDGQRIDNFLIRQLPGVPKARIYRMLRKGEVRINKGRVKPTSRIRAGDSVRVPPVQIQPAASNSAVPEHQVEILKKQILFEDNRLLVISKPSGMAVHGGSGLSFGVVEALRSVGGSWAELSLVHRLDRETSGVLVLTKRRSELRRLHEAFREGRVSKVYQALVVGHWSLGTIDIDAPLAVNERRGGERHVVVSKAGKASLTKVMPTEMRKAGSLVTVHPQTGRTHQIRVHLQHRGHPIVGDSRYGDPDDNRRLKRLGAGRLCLHAQSIAFADEHGGERMFTAPLPEDFETAMDAVFRAS